MSDNIILVGQLYEKRLPLYRKSADVEIDVENGTIDEVAEEIINRLAL